MLPFRLSAGFAAFTLTISPIFLAYAPADAQSAANRVRIRGTLAAIDNAHVEVKARDGSDQVIALKPGYTIAGVTDASITDIKKGDYLGITSVPTSEGGDGAVEVLIFPASMKGAGEGSFAYDLTPNSTMTNGTVAQTVQAVNGRDLTISYNGQQKKISVPRETPIVTFAPATKADLVAGAGVIVTADRADDGSLSATRVAVGLNGLVPPM
jgi:hypothetical protein